ncbi:MAG TPA: electron transfer flavoprotein subunit beta/FixA family protein [Dehalococcoidia bacterium]|nr:electron transfer flavoprotein subunit beta/FixA family protein [Dehalococcoidia bacterium]
MNIVCCVKQVPDPETPARAFRVDEAAKQVVPAPGNPPVISQFDQIAVEAALRIRDAMGEGTITILSLGPDSARDAIKVGLAMGADEAVHLNDPALFDGDGYSTGLALSKAIEKIGNVDLVLTGRQATDWDFGVTGLAIAEMLGWPSVSITRRVTAAGGKIQAERVLGDAFETVEVPVPCVVSVSNELGEPRYPKLPQIMQAARKQVTVWTAADLGLSPDAVGKAGARLSLEKLYIPQVESKVEFIDGDSPSEQAASLARKLREAKLI